MRTPSGVLACIVLAATLGCHRDGATAPGHSTGGSTNGTAASATSAGAAGTSTASPAERTTDGLPIPELGYNAREGRELFRHYCSICHGDEGHGDGFNAYNLDPKPRDLGDPAFQAKRSDEELSTVIRAGGGAAGLSTAMPPWGRTLNRRQINDLVAFLRTLEPEAE